jgi:hypothetical protein
MTILLVVAFECLFPTAFAGARIGIFALLWTIALVIAQPALRRPRRAWLALAIALFLCVALVDDPSALALLLFWSALSIAALMPRAGGFDDAYRWMARLWLHGFAGPFGLFLDGTRALRRPARGNRPSLRSVGGLLTVPLLGTVLFVSLFSAANPVIARAFGSVETPSPLRLAIWTVVAAAVWPAFRPRAIAVRIGFALPEPDMRLPGTSLPSVVIALVLFNAAFAVQNALDIAFLWSGAPLPDGVTLADYAHSGAYPLIITALLAGAFVLLTLRRGSATAGSPLVRRLVVLWVAQNLFLVASSVLRTLDYIAVYQLTAWRIAALAWMALVGVGLILICWRSLRGHSARWLINSNALVAALVLIAACFVDLQAIAAGWNVRHGREVGGSGAAIDLCYLHQIGAPALLPLVELERSRLQPDFRDRLRYVRGDILSTLVRQQGSWDYWTPRDGRRLAAARAQLGANPPKPRELPPGTYRACGGAVQPDPNAITPDILAAADAPADNASSEQTVPTPAELAPLTDAAVARATAPPATAANHTGLTRGAAR